MTNLQKNNQKEKVQKEEFLIQRYGEENLKEKARKMILHLKDEEINNKKMMGEGPNKECEIQY